MDRLKTIQARFFVTANGKEPVREWLKGLDQADRKAIGEDIATCEFQWPVGPPMTDHFREGVWEVRSRLSGGRIARVFFAVGGGVMLLLHGIIKKTRKTPPQDLALAIDRKRIAERREAT